jgi:hypothetical protein
MYGVFQPTPDTAPYSALPARVPLDELNTFTSYGAQASLRMNLEVADMAPELELNEIIWRSVRGADSPMPPPKRAAFIVASAAADEDDEREEAEEREKRDVREAKEVKKRAEPRREK